MKRTIASCLIAVLVALTMPVHASLVVESTVDDSIFVVYHFGDLNSTVYNEAKANPQLNGSTIPRIIAAKLAEQDRTHVTWGDARDEYDDSARSIRISFYLGGSDIISFTMNRTTMRRTYQVRTEWRKFQLNLTSSFSIDFAEHLAKPVVEWQKIDYNDTRGNLHPAYFMEAEGTEPFQMSFYFILPAGATNILVPSDTIIYQMPARFEDTLLNSPFLILGALIILTAGILIYRRIR